MVATLSRRVAEVMVRGSALQLRDLPFRSPTVRTSLLWHRRLEGSPATGGFASSSSRSANDS